MPSPNNIRRYNAITDTMREMVVEVVRASATAASQQQQQLPQLHPGQQLYAVLAAACLDRKEAVSVVLLCYTMLAMMMAARQPAEGDEDGEENPDADAQMQSLLLQHMGDTQGAASVASLGSQVLGVLGLRSDLLNSNTFSSDALLRWPATNFESAALRNAAAMLMGRSSSSSSGGTSFRTVLETERMSWECMLLPLPSAEAVGLETVQGSMRRLLEMMDYDALVAWCGYAAQQGQAQQQQQLQQQAVVEPPQDAVIFADALDQRNPGAVGDADISMYDRDLLSGNLSDGIANRRRRLAIQYGLAYMLVHATDKKDWKDELQGKTFNNRLFHKTRTQQMSAEKVLALARVGCMLPDSFLNAAGAAVAAEMDEATEDLVVKLQGGGYTIAPYVVWKKLACEQPPPGEGDNDFAAFFLPRKLVQSEQRTIRRGDAEEERELTIFEFEDEWLDMPREPSSSFDIFFAVSHSL